MIRREIVLPAPREEVWDALTDAERLEEWFANDVSVDLRPGGGASFGWSNGESRTATVTEVDPERRLTFAWDDEGEVEFTLADDGDGHVAHRRPRPIRPGRRRSICRPPRSRVSEHLNLVFGALADPSRRQVIGLLSSRGTVTATELSGELPMTRQAVAKHLATLADAGLVAGERQGRETRYRLTDAGRGVGRPARRAARAPRAAPLGMTEGSGAPGLGSRP